MLLLKTRYRPDARGRLVEAEVVTLGESLLAAIREAAELARRLECGVAFAFNAHPVEVWPGDDPLATARKYWHAWGWAIPPEEEAWLVRQADQARRAEPRDGPRPPVTSGG